MVTAELRDSRPAHEGVGRLYSLEVENFKSYRGLHTIGPFYNFTAIIGPNGSGKSNLMDAISFVCGVRTSHLRANLKELLYSNQGTQTPEDQPTTGRVALIFEHIDGSKVSFTRSIVPSTTGAGSSYSSRYQVGNTNVSAEVFTQELLQLGINTKARNFLVFQGDIEKVAQQKPAELAGFFELVSGSGALKEEYEELRSHYRLQDERVIELATRQKELRARKKAVKAAKDEAEKFQAEGRQLTMMRRTLFLYLLHHLKLDYASAARAKADACDKEAELLAASTMGSVSELHKQLAKFKKERLAITHSMNKIKAKRDKQNPALHKAKQLLLLKTRDTDAKAKEQGKVREKRLRLERELKEVQRQVGRAKADLRVAEKMAESVGGDLGLTAAHQKEYFELKAKAEAETLEATDAMKAEDSLAAVLRASIAGLEEQLTAMETHATGLDEEIKKREGDVKAKKAAAKEQREAVRRLEKEPERLASAMRVAARDRSALSRSIDDLQTQLVNYTGLEAASRRESELRRAVQELRSRDELAGAVLGRLADVVEPAAARRDGTAVAVLMGRDMDAVVVRTFTAAQRCVEILREKKLPPIEFIPLDRIVAPVINEQLRALGGTARLAIDLLKFDPDLHPAVAYALGNALVVDGVDEARTLGHGRGHKVVTRDGTLIAINGSMSGGTSRSWNQRAQGWDRNAREKLQAVLAEKQAELAALPDEQASAVAEGAARRGLQEAQMALSAADVEAAAEAEALAAKRRELADVTRALRGRKPELATLQRQLAAHESKIVELQAAVDAAKDRIFGEFSQRLGLESVRAHETAISAAACAADEARRTAMRAAREAAADEERAHGELADTDVRLERLSESAEALQRECKIAETELQKLEEGTTGFDAEISKAEVRLDIVKARIGELEGQMKAAQEREHTVTAQLAPLRMKVARAEQAMVAAAEKAMSVTQDAMLASVDLQGAVAAMGVGMCKTVEDSGDESDGAEEDRAPLGSELPEGVPPLPDQLAVDTSGLPPDLRRAAGLETRKAKARELEAEIGELIGHLEDMAPNFKAPEEYEAVLQQEEAFRQDVSAAKAAQAAAHGAFADIRERRTARFNEAFNHVAGVIDRVYKDLTRLGPSAEGTADLKCTQEEEPFEGGVRYSAIPPRKRYRDMAALSGGERTLAALALLLAVHSFRPSPFFVFDEVDAALDANNLGRVANYVRRVTRRGAHEGLQGVVISLKDAFFEKADALVGVTKNRAGDASAVFTFDLSRYSEPET